MVGEWRKTPLSDLTDPDTPVTYGVVKPGPEDLDGVLFIRGGDIAGGRVLTERLRTITREVSEQYKRTLLRGGEIVVSLVGNPGQVAIVPRSLKKANIARQVGLVRLRVDVDARFVKYFLSSPMGQEALGAHSLGSVQQVINLRDLKTVNVPTPPLSAQRAIAHILGTLDDKIELNRQMSETLEAMARAIFKSWFVDFDPVRAKAEARDPGLPRPIADLFPDRFEDSALGEIPEGWAVCGLDTIAQFLNGLALQKYPPDSGRSLPIIKIAQLRTGNTEAADRASADLDSAYIVEDGDVLFSWSGSLACVLWAGGRGALNQHLFKVTSQRFPKWFYYNWIQQHLSGFRHIAAGKATTMGHIQRHHLSEALVVAPAPKILVAADRQIAPLVDSVVRNAVQCRTLAALRDLLLPKLISGELRIENVEGIVRNFEVPQSA